MANCKSAEKRIRQNEKRHSRNQYWKSTVRTAIKKVRVAVEKKDVETATTYLREATRLLNKVASKGVLHHCTAARKVSRLTQLVNTLSA